MLAIILTAGRPARSQVLPWTGVAALTITAGTTRLYLGANWLTDVLAGWALGALWVALILTADVLITRLAGQLAAPAQKLGLRDGLHRQRSARMRGCRSASLFASIRCTGGCSTERNLRGMRFDR